MKREQVGSDEWLLDNESLRMDANNELFPENRRKFHLRRYQFASMYCEGKKVLDGACGTGYGSALISQVAREVVGVDLSEEAVEYASEKYGNQNTEFSKQFVEYTSFESGAFDVVVSFETVEHTLCPQSHIREIARVMEPNKGIAILSVPNDWGLTDHHFFDFNFNLLQSLLEPVFEKVDYFYQQSGVMMDDENGGIGPINSVLPIDAQCILAICSRPKLKDNNENRLSAIMEEIYTNAFRRHNEFRGLAYKVNTSILKRIHNKILVVWNNLSPKEKK